MERGFSKNARKLQKERTYRACASRAKNVELSNEVHIEHLFRLKGCKGASCQILRFEKIWYFGLILSVDCPPYAICVLSDIFFHISNFDIWYCNSPLSCKDAQNLIWKIYILSKAYFFWKMLCSNFKVIYVSSEHQYFTS